jgi:glycosyltransferase involved in cell wall biosynthesis
MKRSLLVRGDLRSHFGMAQMLRSLLPLVEQLFDEIHGVDLHHHPKFDTHSFSYPITTDKDIQARILKQNDTHWTVLHHTTPDQFHRFQNATNLGYFLWETDRAPKDTSWRQDFRQLDALWVAAPYLGELARRLGWQKPILTVPWPMSPLKEKADTRLPEKGLHRVLNGKIERTTLDKLKKDYEGYDLSIASDAPRKGISILISEWVRYQRISQRKYALILKLSTFNTSKTEKDLLEECLRTTYLACAPHNPADIGLHIMARPLSDQEISNLYASVRALLSTTIGEGFGGPVAEAAMHGKPIVAPRHSSLEQIIPEGYPLALEHDNVTLAQGIKAPYSISSTWGLIRPDTLRNILLRLDDLGAEEITKLGKQIHEHVTTVCSPKVILSDISLFLDKHINPCEPML